MAVFEAGNARPDYEPVDLSAFSNAGLELLEGRRTPPIGAVGIHGIPFLIGKASSARAPCFIGLDVGGPTVTVPIDRHGDRLIVAHRWLRRAGPEADPPPGTVVGEYAFHLEDGSSESVPIRERFEIAAAPDEGWDVSAPFEATGDNELLPLDRFRGRWEDIGMRQCEAVFEVLADYFLWVWRNPRPELAVRTIELRAVGERMLVAAITVANAREHPFPLEAARVVRFSARGPDGPIPLVEPMVEVDRGLAGYAFGLSDSDVQTYLDDPLRGWGEDANSEAPSAYARITAVPSATVSVKDGGRDVGRFRWGDLGHDAPIERDDLRVEVAERGRNWVHVTVLDEETGRPAPCRVHFRSPEGIPYQPHGHHDHANSDLGSWHVDVGGDVRLGRTTYAYIDGTCQGWLPRGDVIVDVARGYEYEPIREVVNIARGQRALELRLRRWASMNAEGWYSGDSHVHFLSAQGSVLEQQGEDLNVVNLLQSQWGSLFTNTEDFTGGPLATADGRYLTWVSQENRQPFFGHLVLWGLRRPVMPWCTDGPNEAELGAWQETTMSDWADRCREQGGTVVIPHFPQPNGEPAVLIATDRADAVEMIVQRRMQHADYYRYLNGGYRLPLVGGTDKMSSDVPVGLVRTYARLGGEQFSFEAWTRAVRQGRTFLSSGPILRLRVDGHEIGDTVRLSRAGTLSVEASAESVLPIASLQVVMNGEVVAETVETTAIRRLELRAEILVERDSWVAARSGGPAYWDGPSHRGPWERRVFAHTSPVYVTCGSDGWSRSDPEQDRRMLALIEGGLERIRRGRRYPEDRITHHHVERSHEAFLERPFLEARERVRARMGK
jgi:hypothetical protein